MTELLQLFPRKRVERKGFGAQFGAQQGMRNDGAAPALLQEKKVAPNSSWEEIRPSVQGPDKVSIISLHVRLFWLLEDYSSPSAFAFPAPKLSA